MKSKLLAAVLTLAVSVGLATWAPSAHAANSVSNKAEARAAALKKAGTGSKVIVTKKSKDGKHYEVRVLKKGGAVRTYTFRIKN